MSSPGKCSVEEQLAEYRARKKKEQVQKVGEERLLERLMAVMPFGRTRNNASSDSQAAASIDTEEIHNETVRKRISLPQESSSRISTDQSNAQGKQTTPMTCTEYFDELYEYTTLDWIALALKCVMWLILFKMFIILEFGAVFFIFSAFFFMWYNLRSGPKKKGEISAYSVFNPNCETINGTLSAEQFEREILHKM